MYSIYVLGAACGTTTSLLAAFNGRRVQAGICACLAGHTVIRKIFSTALPAWLMTVLPEWLVFPLSVAAAVLFIIDYINRQRVLPPQQDIGSVRAAQGQER